MTYEPKMGRSMQGVVTGFHDKTIYQVYPKSFCDSDGDGVGDLRGITRKVPYIASLGVDMVWLNPFFVSPQRDNGYDIANYYRVNPALGSMDDFEELVAALRAHGIGVMLDMVLNHTSTQHEWFQRALAGETEYRDFYYIRPATSGLPNNWVSKFGGPAWAPFTGNSASLGITDADAARNGFTRNPAGDDSGDPTLYYLHLYDVTQADLNWHNPRVRNELAKVVRFWQNKGVQGFRFDVINVIGKPEDLPSALRGTDDKRLYTDTPIVEQYIKELAAASFGRDPESVTVGEMSSTSIERCIAYTNPDNKALSMVFNFHHLKVDYVDGHKWSRKPFDFQELKRLFAQWGVGMERGGGWNALFWNNHDQPRALNRFGDPRGYRVESATMLATAIHMMRGTPFVYMGEEIGMTDPEYASMDDYVDIEAINAYRELVATGTSTQEAFAIVHSKARDNARTPMQWDDSAHAGFTTGTPWLRPTNQSMINVAAEEASGKILPYYRALIVLRKKYAVISEGSYEPYAEDHLRVLAFTRTFGNDRLLVLANFYGEETMIQIPPEFVGGSIVIANYEDRKAVATNRVVMRPYEAITIWQR